MTPEWIPYANLALNLFILPLAKWMWDIRVDVAKINGRLTAVESRIDRVETRHDSIDANRRDGD